MPKVLELIEHVGEFTDVYRNKNTGVAFVYNAQKGTKYSCHPNIEADGSVREMKKSGAWGRKDRIVRGNGYIYDIDILSVNFPVDAIAAKHCMCVACQERRQGIKPNNLLTTYKLSEIYPKGISHKQADQLHAYLFKVFGRPFESQWPKDAKMLEKELSMVSMLASHYAYGSVKTMKAVFKEPRPVNPIMNPKGESYYDNYLRDYMNCGGTKGEFDKYIDIQIDHYKRSDVLKGVGADGEGNVYNTIVEPDEPCNIKF